MKLKLRKENVGITLIALVVSIIVLLILSGVTIAMLMGQNRNTYTNSKCKICNRNGPNKR